jgi:hypothetical protein
MSVVGGADSRRIERVSFDYLRTLRTRVGECAAEQGSGNAAMAV